MTEILKTVARAWRDVHLMVRIFFAIIIGSILALTCPGINAISILGTLFVGALKAVAPVLVFVLVASSLAQSREKLGSQFATIIILYLITSFNHSSSNP